jgi:hypothetical protein
LRVHQLLADEKVALEKILAGARRMVHEERQKAAEASRAYESERAARVQVEQTLHHEREERSLVEDDLRQQLARLTEENEAVKKQEHQLRMTLVRTQTRALYHILVHLEQSRINHFFQTWIRYAKEMEMQRVADDLHQINTDAGREKVIDAPVVAAPQARRESMDVEALDIYKMGADVGLFSDHTAKSMAAARSNSPPSRDSYAHLDANGDGHIDSSEWSAVMADGNPGGGGRRSASQARSSASVSGGRSRYDASSWHGMIDSAVGR